MTSLPATPSASPPSSPARAVPVIATMCLAVVLVIASVAALSPALRTIGTDVGASQTELQWIVDAFAVSLAALLLPAGAWGDRIGRRRVMLIGFAVFSAGGLLSAVADDAGWLIAGRVVAGIGAALVFPGTLSTLLATLPDDRRGLGLGLWTASASLGGTIGLVVSGGLVEVAPWWSTFLFLAGFGALTGLATALVVPESRDPDPGRFDGGGALLSTLGIAAVVVAVIEGPHRGWTDVVTLTAAAVGLGALTGFTVWSLRQEDPLFDVALFRVREFRIGWLVVGAQFVVVFGFFFVAAQLLGFVEGYGPFVLAAALLPVGLLLPVASLAAPGLAARLGRGVVGGAGLAVMALACLGFAALAPADPWWWFGAVLVVFGIGMGLAGPPGTDAIVAALPPERQGVASAANDVARELGGALGIALLGSVLTTTYRDAVDAAALPTGVAETARESAATGLATAEGLAGSGDPTTGEAVARAVQDAVAAGFSDAMLAAAAFLFVAAVLAALPARRRAAT